MGYQRKPNYHFSDKNATGIDKVPEGRVIIIDDYEGDGSKQVKQFIKRKNDGGDSTTTLEDALGSGILGSEIQDLESKIDTEVFAQHGLVPNDGVNEIKPQDMFQEVDVADVLVDKKGYPVRFTDGVYDRLGDDLSSIVTNGFSESSGIGSQRTFTVVDDSNEYIQITAPVEIGDFVRFSFDTYGIDLATIGYIYIYNSVEHDDSTNLRTSGLDITKNKLDNGITLQAKTTGNIHIRWVTYANKIGYSMSLDNISVKELPQFALPKAPFATGSTDELLDDKVNGLTTQSNHSTGDIVVTGNELVENGTFETVVDGEVGHDNGDGTVDGYTIASGVGNVSIVNNMLKLENTGGDYYQEGTIISGLIAGNEYTISLHVDNSSTSLFDMYSKSNSTYFFLGGSGVLIHSFIAVDNNLNINIRPTANATGYVLIDNISVKLKDQSYIATEDTTTGELLAYPEWVSGQAKSVDNMVQNDNKVYKCIQAVVGDEDPAIAITDTLYWEYQFNSKFKAIPYVTKQVALLIEKTSTGEVLNTVKPLVNMYGEESVETYEADIMSELGYSQKADRVWTDGNSEFILVGLKGYLNAGAYHPWVSSFGTKKTLAGNGNGVSWHQQLGTGDYDRANELFSLYDCFNHIPTVYESGCINGFEVSRPDSKFYDKTYIEGQGGLIIYAIPNAKTPTYKHQEEVKRNLVDGYIENGVEMRYFKFNLAPALSGAETYFNRYLVLLSTNIVVSLNAYPAYDSAFGISFMFGSNLYRFYKWNNVWNYGIEKNIAGVWTKGDYVAELNCTDSFVLCTVGTSCTINQSPYLATMGTTTHTDLIGDPANYPSDLKSVLASTKGVGFMNALLTSDNGDSYINPVPAYQHIKLSKKVIGRPLFQIYDEDTSNGITWTGTSGNASIESFNTVKNMLGGAYNIAQNRLNLMQYLTSNQSAIPVSTPKKVEYVDRDLIASNHHSVYAYNGLTYAGTGKVATGSSVESKSVEDVQPITYDFVDEDKLVYAEVGHTVLVLGTNTSGIEGHVYQRTDRFSGNINNGTATDFSNTVAYVNLGAYMTPSHQTISLDNQSIVGSKALVTQTSDATQVFSQEMIWNGNGFGCSGEFDALTNTTELDLNGNSVQHKVLLKPSSVKIGE